MRGREVAVSVVSALLLLGMGMELAVTARGDDTAVLLRDMRGRVAPWLVRIETTGGSEQVGTHAAIRQATGVLLSGDGFLVASAVCVAHHPDAILVQTHGAGRFVGRVVARDAVRNLALLKIDPESPLVQGPPEWAPVSELRPGMDTFAFGRVLHPTEVSVTSGVLSAKGRFEALALQTDAHTSPNNYGGPLLDLRGRVLGIITPLDVQDKTPFGGVEYYDSGVGFAIPLETALARLETWKTGDVPLAPTLGVVFDNPNPVLAGTRVLHVEPGSLAEKAGVRTGDVVLTVNGTEVRRGYDVLTALAQGQPADSALLTVRRGKETVTVTVVFGGK